MGSSIHWRIMETPNMMLLLCPIVSKINVLILLVVYCSCSNFCCSHSCFYFISTKDFPQKDEDGIPVELPAGGAIFFNGYLLHKSLPNVSNGFRRAFANHYMSAEVRVYFGFLIHWKMISFTRSSFLTPEDEWMNPTSVFWLLIPVHLLLTIHWLHIPSPFIQSMLPWNWDGRIAGVVTDMRDIIMVCGHDPYTWKVFNLTMLTNIPLELCLHLHNLVWPDTFVSHRVLNLTHTHIFVPSPKHKLPISIKSLPHIDADLMGTTNGLYW